MPLTMEQLIKENEKLKKEHDLCWNKMWKLKEQLDCANECCGWFGYKWDSKWRVYWNEDDGLSDSEDE